MRSGGCRYTQDSRPPGTGFVARGLLMRALAQQALRPVTVRAQRLEPRGESLLPDPAGETTLPSPVLRVLTSPSLNMIELEKYRIRLTTACTLPPIVTQAQVTVAGSLTSTSLTGLLQVRGAPVCHTLHLALLAAADPVLVPAAILLLARFPEMKAPDRERASARSQALLLHVITLPGVLTR